VLGSFARRARVVAVATLLVFLGSAAAWAAEYPGPVDEYASYQPEDGCRHKPMKGTRQLAAWLEKAFDGGSAVTATRACTSSTSEHQDGRAIDWMMDATSKADRAEVTRFLGEIFATDVDAEAHALARRMGIMYVIWNDHMYASYRQFEKRDYLSSSCPSRKKCSKTLRHRDHVHLSLSRPGGRAATTWYGRTP